MKTTSHDDRLLESLRSSGGPSLITAYKLRVHYQIEAKRIGLKRAFLHLHELGVPVDVAAWLLTPVADHGPPSTWVITQVLHPAVPHHNSLTKE